MVSELDRWRAAQQLINAHGDEAQYHAGVRAAGFLREGQLDGLHLWQDIALKIKRLRTVGRSESN